MMRTIFSGLDIWDALFGLLVFLVIILLLVLEELIAGWISKFRKWRLIRKSSMYDRNIKQYAEQDVKMMLKLYDQHMNNKEKK